MADRSSSTREHVALFRWLPQLAARVPWQPLGDWPTPLDELSIDGWPVWVKREGDSSPLYGGNKVRTLEAWFGHARAQGARRIWAIGAYGSNHAIATALHAPTLGMAAGAIVFPQPASEWAAENAGALVASASTIVRLRSVIEVPFVALAIAARNRRDVVMPPGGATTLGTLGAASAAFELGEQIAAGAAPPPTRIVLAVGSTCTSAGLLAGLSLARAVGAWRWPLPIVHAVRVTPWPITSRSVIVGLAARTLARIAALGGPNVALAAQLVVDARELGAGYGRTTPRSADAMTHLTGVRLDGVYSAKSAAALLRLHHTHAGPLVFWSTKSSVRVAGPSVEALRRAAPTSLIMLRKVGYLDRHLSFAS
jgi:D-cysteine desulfhydrase